MRLVRSFPDVVPPFRAHVRDDAQKLYNSDWDYSGLAGFSDDVLHLDWDIAVAQEDLRLFAARARSQPDRVLVAPYRLYPDTRPGLPGQRRAGLPGPVWALQRFEGEGAGLRRREVQTGEPTCHLFGFGMVYLPQALIKKFRVYAQQPASRQIRMDDITFSQWHHREIEAEVPIAWDVRPVHLNYPISTVL